MNNKCDKCIYEKINYNMDYYLNQIKNDKKLTEWILETVKLSFSNKSNYHY